MAFSIPHALVCTEVQTWGSEASAEKGKKGKGNELGEKQEGPEHSLEVWTPEAQGDLPESEV